MTKAEAIRELRKQAGAIKALGATALYLFGSTARNRASAKSDVDILSAMTRAGDSMPWIWWRPSDCLRRVSVSRLILPPAKGSIR